MTKATNTEQIVQQWHQLMNNLRSPSEKYMNFDWARIYNNLRSGHLPPALITI